ncbi:MAG: haloacid dehalogenase-like hydrolase [Bacteroidales bacterium]|nr:haloacid dehalogenase-like hydrolase [Bacteroidales bacterium]
MARKKTIDVALVYDFDGTLSPGNMQEFGFVQALGKDPKDFWEKTGQLAKENDANAILCYMYLMLQEAKANNISLKRKSFKQFGSQIELYEGVEKWFARINEYGKSIGLNIKHYINSSGLREMIEGTKIASEFENIYACSFLYDVDGIAYWPAVAVDYTTKTQFLFKINKGIKEVSDNKKINEYLAKEERPIPFERMIYFGDGETDIPSMRVVKEQGGHSIAVYGNPRKKATARKLIHEDRVNFACKADYSEGKEIDTTVRKILEKIRADYDFQQLLDSHKRGAR